MPRTPCTGHRSPGLALFPFRHDLYGIIGTDRLADPAAGADILIQAGNGCLGLVGILGKDGAGPDHGSTGLRNGLIDEFRGMACIKNV